MKITNDLVFTYFLTLSGIMSSEVITTGRWFNFGDFWVKENIFGHNRTIYKILKILVRKYFSANKEKSNGKDLKLRLFLQMGVYLHFH
jgi:hypothetical protein